MEVRFVIPGNRPEPFLENRIKIPRAVTLPKWLRIFTSPSYLPVRFVNPNAIPKSRPQPTISSFCKTPLRPHQPGSDNMKSMNRALICLGLALAVSIVAGAKDKRIPGPQTQAVLLDHAEYLCNNCFFGASDYYFCFDVNSKILIGHEKIVVQTWMKAPENLIAGRGQTVPIKFDDKYIWIPGPKGKDQRLIQDYSKDLFTFSDACRKAARVTGNVTEKP